MPLPSFLMVLDSALAISTHDLCSGLRNLPTIFERACKGNQASEIGFLSQMLLEKGMDDRSQACVGGADI